MADPELPVGLTEVAADDAEAYYWPLAGYLYDRNGTSLPFLNRHQMIPVRVEDAFFDQSQLNAVMPKGAYGFDPEYVGQACSMFMRAIQTGHAPVCAHYIVPMLDDPEGNPLNPVDLIAHAEICANTMAFMLVATWKMMDHLAQQLRSGEIRMLDDDEGDGT